MIQLGDSDLYYRTFEAPDVFRWEYLFKSFESDQLDRRNPEVVLSGGRAVSVVARLDPKERRWRPTLRERASAASSRR